MRYRIISLEWDRSEHWINKTVATFADCESAIKVCGRLPIPAYVIDAWDNRTIYRS